jgi:hypothetical protein
MHGSLIYNLVEFAKANFNQIIEKETNQMSFYATCPVCEEESEFNCFTDRDDHNTYPTAELEKRGCDHVDDEVIFAKMEEDVLESFTDNDREPSFDLSFEPDWAQSLVML